MRKKGLMAVSIALLFWLFQAASLGARGTVDSVTFKLYIPVVQELYISTNYPSSVVQVGREDEKRAYSSIVLEAPETDLGQRDLRLPKAIQLHILSNVNWRVMASIRSLEVIPTDTGPLPIEVMIRASDLPPGVTGAGTFVHLPVNTSIEIARGEPLRKSFTVDYLFRLTQEKSQTPQSLTVDVTYTLIKL